MSKRQKQLSFLMSMPAEWVRGSAANPTPYMSRTLITLHHVALRRMGA